MDVGGGGGDGACCGGAMMHTRSMNILMYVLYSKDERFVYDMVKTVLCEVSHVYNMQHILKLLEYKDRPILFRCLFFLLMNFYTSFRYWILSNDASRENGLSPLCPHKASRFLVVLRDELILKFLVNENMCMEDFERSIKEEYHRA